MPGEHHSHHPKKDAEPDLVEQITEADQRREDEMKAECDRFEGMFGDGDGDEK